MILAITTRLSYEDDTKEFTWYHISHPIVRICEALGITLFPVVSEQNIDEICKMCDGLILPGSSNHIPPHYYKQDPIAEHPYELHEYELDSAAIKTFANAGKPILGICGGHQAINVFYGGTLNQLIDGHNGSGLTHKTNIKRGTFLSKTYGKDSIETNTYHRQSIKDLAEGFVISAVAEDGTIEAIEKGNIVGIQWHPEIAKDMEFFHSYVEHFLK